MRLLIALALFSGCKYKDPEPTTWSGIPPGVQVRCAWTDCGDAHRCDTYIGRCMAPGQVFECIQLIGTQPKGGNEVICGQTTPPVSPEAK